MSIIDTELLGRTAAGQGQQPEPQAPLSALLAAQIYEDRFGIASALVGIIVKRHPIGNG